MVDTAGGDYREKYRRAIAEQERMEKQFKFQLDALRKTLTHVSAAAQGLDKRLDASLIQLKEKMRGASGSQVLEQMERVQSAAADYEHSRHINSANVAKQVGSIAGQLSELKLPNSLKESIEGYSKGVKKRLDSYRNYPMVLEELSKLQALALEEAANPPTSFWQRLKGGKTLVSPQQEEVNEAPSTPTGQKNSDVADAVQEAEEAEDFVWEDTEDDNLVNIDDCDDREVLEGSLVEESSQEGEVIQAGEQGGLFKPGDEDSYHKVAQRIAETLENLMSRIEPNELVKHKVDIVRLRIQRGMDWYVLAVTLEDIRDILLLRYLQGDEEFSQYLKRVNSELLAITEALGVASDQNESYRKASDAFSSVVSDQVEQMRTNMENSNTIDDLKLAVSDHLEVIHSALGDYKLNQQTSSVSLTEQLQSLVSKVQSIELESEKTKQQLEEQRYRATHDPLTGLPNREAYNERAFQEMQRFKRYCRPLTMAVCDIDHFKKINDTYGHQAGDKVLKLISKLISTRLRKVDFVARYGGEEFVSLMPETTPTQALDVLDKVRSVIGKTPFKFKGNPVNITISFGLADFGAEDTVESVFERADQALYKAKKEGRNRCVIAPSADAEK